MFEHGSSNESTAEDLIGVLFWVVVGIAFTAPMWSPFVFGFFGFLLGLAI